MRRAWFRGVVLGVSLPIGVLAVARYLPAGRPTPLNRFEVVAHRGLHQTAAVDVGMSGCTAANINPPEHEFIENTLPSMEAAFDLGASVVELDIHPTTDGGMVVFHDWTVDCQTDGTGQTDELAVAYLKSLDVGYGYTADGGMTFPLRGKGIGMMPTLQEVLNYFPGRGFLVNQKDRWDRTLPVLAAILGEYPRDVRRRIFYTGPFPERARALIPDLGGIFLGRSQLKECARQFAWRLGFGPLPSPCQASDVTLPPWATPYVFGWPNRFLKNARASRSRVFLYINRPEEVQGDLSVPVDGVVTDRIDVVGPWLKASGRIS